jgi:arabinose-5-phosphate isomerase
MNDRKLQELALAVIHTEAAAINGLSKEIMQPSFIEACRLMLACRGRVVVTGMGKSGHIAGKIAATLASTGTPAFFVHPAEASHGDLGMITAQDVMIALSNSGESAELLAIVPLIKRRGARLVAITGRVDSPLALAADVHLEAAVSEEACPLGLAPTASTTAALALGDALALALLDARGFSAEDFARTHPGGALGRRLLTHVSDVMRTGAELPTVKASASIAEAMLEMTSKSMGMTAVLDDDAGHVAGIFTDGDLRRSLPKVADLRAASVCDHMSRHPRSIGPDRLAAEAVQMMEASSIMQLLVLDDDGRLVGALNWHDLFRARVI